MLRSDCFTTNKSGGFSVQMMNYSDEISWHTVGACSRLNEQVKCPISDLFIIAPRYECSHWMTV